MYVYIYRAALYCEACAARIKAHLGEPHPLHLLDSERYPAGPYGDGGGEADCPQHCDQCHTFLENPLTPDGRAYVEQAIADHAAGIRGNREVLALWAGFYGVTWPDNRVMEGTSGGPLEPFFG